MMILHYLMTQTTFLAALAAKFASAELAAATPISGMELVSVPPAAPICFARSAESMMPNPLNCLIRLMRSHT
ncbi:MAG: hypothetical protein JO252_12075 [Planctomycetaceae bacterium]|nr:hypothetical protein [Planctomycetaceae bacterium]MBV8555800.1 hypothetical protein [Planctomycetaceae bacterium]